MQAPQFSQAQSSRGGDSTATPPCESVAMKVIGSTAVSDSVQVKWKRPLVLVSSFRSEFSGRPPSTSNWPPSTHKSYVEGSPMVITNPSNTAYIVGGDIAEKTEGQ